MKQHKSRVTNTALAEIVCKVIKDYLEMES